MEWDVIVLGAGPAGSTVATLLARSGQRVLVLEQANFPRFHIGESLLPATVRIFDRLGVHDAIRNRFVLKPGGRWLYGSTAVDGDFDKPDSKASFQNHRYSYLVDRSQFDHLLIQRSEECGADVRFRHDAVDLLRDGSRVVGVTARDAADKLHEFRARLVVDATGLRALIGSKLRLRKPDPVQRMGIYAQYRSLSTRDDCRQGWFVGQMFYDGWTWLIRLDDDVFSVGAVLTVDRFKRSGLSPQALLERLLHENPLLSDGLSPQCERISDVMVTGNMGNSCQSLYGDGWVTVGDAAFFIDPCYSSGVHLAMMSAEQVADIVLTQPTGCSIPAVAFAPYQKQLKQHETSVRSMVDAFYIASRNTSVQNMFTKLQGGWLTRRFVTFVGGDFSRNAGYIRRMRWYSKIVDRLFPNNNHRAPENHPDYLVAPADTARACDVVVPTVEPDQHPTHTAIG